MSSDKAAVEEMVAEQLKRKLTRAERRRLLRVLARPGFKEKFPLAHQILKEMADRNDTKEAGV